MPSSSKKQHNFMAAVAHSPSFAKKVGVSQSVGKEFTAADKGKKFMNPRARKAGGKVVKMAKGGMRTKANWNTWEPEEEKEETKSLTPEDSFDEDVPSINSRRNIAKKQAEDYMESSGINAALKGINEEKKEEAPKKEAAKEEAPKKQSFGEAFRAAKGSDFTWNGKKYSGKTKEQAATAAPKRSEPSVLPKAPKDDSTVDARENNRLRSANPAMWDAAKKVESDKPRRAPDTTANMYSSKVSTLGNAGWKKGGTIKKTKPKVKAYAAGGSVRGGGCESKGKTKGRMR